jgi:hypothetical protein
MALNLPGASVTYPEAGAAPDASTYTGGTILSGRYFLTAVAHYGGGTYSGPVQAQYIIDATAQTIAIGERMGATYYEGMSYAPVDAHTLAASVLCNTSPNSSMSGATYDYTVSGSTLTLTVNGSADVLTLTLIQAA